MPPRNKAHTFGSSSFDPDAFLKSWDHTLLPETNDLRTAIITAFNLGANDSYVYHAIASVTLAQVQVAIDQGSQNDMHTWYRDENGRRIDPPPPADVDAYTKIFSPSTSTVKALTTFGSNAKKGSIRAAIALNLQSRLQLSSPPSTTLSLPAKQKNITLNNPYYDFWIWSCQCLEWAGPTDSTVEIHQSHHILPIFYHHFGCVCPSWDALSLIKQITCPKARAKNRSSQEKAIIDIGSGNGYWTFLLRRLGITVYAVDNALSEWRTMWIGDTILSDGVEFLEKPPADLSTSLGGRGCPGSVLLLVYPQVSNDFTSRIIRTYQGDVIVVAGTQNGNGFTAFRDENIATWMERERPEFQKIVQIPLPSFAAKDEALFVFSRTR